MNGYFMYSVNSGQTQEWLLWIGLKRNISSKRKDYETEMTGADLINWIQDHNAEEYEVIVYRDGYNDFLGSGLDEPDDKERIIYI